MILLPDQWHSFYEGVREDKHNTSEKNVPIFVYAADCDSVCSLKILQAILGRSDIKYSVHVVTTFGELKERLLGEIGADAGEELRTFFCVNCGATTPINDLLDGLLPSVREVLRVVVIDSHRPIHHSFNDPGDSGAVLLLDSDCDVDPADVPVSETVIEEREERGPSQRQRTGEDGSSQPLDEGPNDARVEWAAELGHYYSKGSTHGIPSSIVLHNLAHQLHMDNSFLLWMAVLGVAEQLILKRVTETSPHYVRCMLDLQTYITHLDSVQQQELYGEGFESDEDEDADASRTSSAAHGVIRPGKEYKLLLYRHWTLLEALTFSPELASRMRTFKEGSGGRGTLEVILAKTGIPLMQAGLKFSQMRHQNQKLLGVLSVNIVAHSIDDYVMTYDSFTVEYTNRLTLSAADHVHAIMAHLTHEANRTNSINELTAGFWKAYCATDIATHGSMVKDGIAKAMDQHKRLLQDCATCNPLGSGVGSGSLVTRGEINECDLVDLSNHEAWASASPTVHPLSMLQLSCLLQETVVARDHYTGKNTQAWKLRPLVYISPPSCTGECLVLGLAGLKKIRKHPVTKRVLPSSHNGVLNIFGSSQGLLRAAVENSEMNSASHVFFNSAILRISRDEVPLLIQAVNTAYMARDQEVWQLENRIEADY